MVDPLLLADAQRCVLDALAGDEAEEARLFACRVRHLAAAAELFERGAGVEHFLTIELAGTCRIGQIRGANRLDEAVRLTGVFLDTLELLERGEMFVHTAQLLLSLTKACTEQVQTRVQSRVLPTVVGLGPGDARRLVESTTLEVEAEIDAALTAERRARARRRRRVWVSADPDGMGAVTGTMTAEQLRRWTLDFEELVRAQKLADRDGQVERTADQRRADVFAELPSRQLALIQALQQGTVAELLPETAEPVVAEPEPTEPVEVPDRLAGMSVEQLGVELVRLPVRNPQVINVHIPMTAVLEIDHRPGVLEGYGHRVGGARPVDGAGLRVAAALGRRPDRSADRDE